MTIFISEKTIRREIQKSKSFADRTFWIEPNIGSTNGLPDCFVLMGWEKIVWLELKLATITVEGGRLSYKIRPAQKDVLLSLTGKGQTCFVLAGEENGTRLWLLPPEREVINGNVHLSRFQNCECIAEGLWQLLFRKVFPLATA